MLVFFFIVYSVCISGREVLVVKYPELHSELTARVENEAHVTPPILAAKFLVSSRLNAYRTDAAAFYTLQLVNDKLVILVMQPEERSNIVAAFSVYDFI